MPLSRHQSIVRSFGDQPIPLIATVLPSRGRVDERGNLAADAVAVRLQEVQAEAHGRRRVDRVAALLHDAEAGGGGEVVAGGDHSPGPHDDRTCREPCHDCGPAARGAPHSVFRVTMVIWFRPDTRS